MKTGKRKCEQEMEKNEILYRQWKGERRKVKEDLK